MTDLLTLTTPTGAYVLSVDGWFFPAAFAFAVCVAIVVAAGRVKP